MDHESNLIQIRKQLESGQRITVQSVLSSIGTQELRTYIPKLRRKFNMTIIGEWVERNGKHFKEYYTIRDTKPRPVEEPKHEADELGQLIIF